MRKNIGIILAGGSGRRIGGDIPKQFLTIAGRTILEYTLATFQKHSCIDEIAVVVNPIYQDKVRELIRTNRFTKVRHLLANGAERYHSTLSALNAYQQEDCNLLIHDAVRPLVSGRIIQEVADNLTNFQVVNVAIPATDTIIEVDETKTFIERIPNRSRLYQVQTPQGFYRPVLQRAYDLALLDPDFQTTDDCGVVKKYLPEERIKIVAGEISNIKITWPEDLAYAESFLNSIPQG